MELGSIKPCETDFKSLFGCLNEQVETKRGDLNACRNYYTSLKTCTDAAEHNKVGEHEPEGEGTDKRLSEALQAVMPRVFKNVEDLPRERTILSDTLAKVAPHIFDPKDDDDDDKDKDKDK